MIKKKKTEDDHFTLAQKAVDTIQLSKHQTSKVGACLRGTNIQDIPYTISQPNDWPPTIENSFGRDAKIGNSSGTIHAETACILGAPDKTENATLYITDPPCPNCMKNMAEAGIRNIYIDHKGFDKDFARRRGHHFENMSMRICEKAGINLYKINRKANIIETITEASQQYIPKNENPVFISKLDTQLPQQSIWQQKIAESKAIYGDTPFALCLGTSKKNETFCIAAKKHPTIGYTAQNIESACCKYSFVIEPLNRLLMNAARKGIAIQDGFIYASRCPTSRELVNVIGANLTTIQIGNQKESRDEFGPAALKQLTDAQILNIKN